MELQPTGILFMVTSSMAGAPVIKYCVGEQDAIDQYDKVKSYGLYPRIFAECKIVAMHPTLGDLHESSTPPDHLPPTHNASDIASQSSHGNPLQALGALQVDQSGQVHTSSGAVLGGSKTSTSEKE
jgi:hypothetical protein